VFFKVKRTELELKSTESQVSEEAREIQIMNDLDGIKKEFGITFFVCDVLFGWIKMLFRA